MHYVYLMGFEYSRGSDPLWEAFIHLLEKPGNY